MDRLQLLSPFQSRVPFQVEVGTIQFSESASRECSPYRQTAARTKQRERGRERGFLGLPSIFAALRKERPLPREGEEEGRVPASPNLTARLPVIQPVKGCNTHMKTQFFSNPLVNRCYSLKAPCSMGKSINKSDTISLFQCLETWQPVEVSPSGNNDSARSASPTI